MISVRLTVWLTIFTKQLSYLRVILTFWQIWCICCGTHVGRFYVLPSPRVRKKRLDRQWKTWVSEPLLPVLCVARLGCPCPRGPRMTAGQHDFLLFLLFVSKIGTKESMYISRWWQLSVLPRFKKQQYFIKGMWIWVLGYLRHRKRDWCSPSEPSVMDRLGEDCPTSKTRSVALVSPQAGHSVASMLSLGVWGLWNTWAGGGVRGCFLPQPGGSFCSALFRQACCVPSFHLCPAPRHGYDQRVRCHASLHTHAQPFCAVPQTCLSSCLLYLLQGNWSHKECYQIHQLAKDSISKCKEEMQKDAVVSMTVSTELLSRKY